MRTRILVALVLAVGPALGLQCGSGWTSPHDPLGKALFASPQAAPLALTPDGSRLYVANTTSGTLSVIDTASRTVLLARLRVGLDPVSVAVRPDGLQVLVANHVSDSISVVDTDPTSPSYHSVVQTVQDLDANGATRFDEPVGVAFASSTKAYVGLSSTNEIAVLELVSGRWSVDPTRIPIAAQEPRAIAVRNGRLYVAAFESGNQTEISACPSGGSPPHCTIGDTDILNFAQSPNLPGLEKNILVDPDFPDRDLFVFDASDESPIDVVNGVGTLLYGLAVDSAGRVFVAQTDARNAVNGMDGGALGDLDNRLFLNQIGVVDCGGASCGGPSIYELEPLPPSQPASGDALATPYGIAVSGDDLVLVATAAASSRLFTLNAATGAVRGRVDVGAIPRGVALRSDPGSGAPLEAWVLDTLDDTVTLVDVANPDAPFVLVSLAVGSDRTPEAVRRGRIAFNSAEASTTKTFACASCHPDAHVDQLMWRIGGACDPGFDPGCGGDEPRSTMPIRGLTGSLPLHWDGTLGDPFGGGNGAVGPSGAGGSDCALGDADGEHDCFVDLANASLSGVMCDPSGSCPPGGVELTGAEIDDMARFLAAVSYPPARSRRLDDSVSASALDGFADFFMDQGGIGGFAGVDGCADADSGCHALPLGLATNSPIVGGFEAPTMRGMTDRVLLFSLGHTATQEVLENNTSWNPLVDGPSEFFSFAAGFPTPTAGFSDAYGVLPDDLFQMFEEASTGTSGALGRQVTLDVASTSGAEQAATWALVDALEAADARAAVNLYGDGVRAGVPVSVSYKAGPDVWQVGSQQLARAAFETEVESGVLAATVTAHLPPNAGKQDQPQPLIATVGVSGPTGSPDLPVLPGDNPMTLVAERLLAGAAILVDGAPVAGSVTCAGGSFAPFCDSDEATVGLSVVPPNGTHLLQLQNPEGLASNELPICVGSVAGCL